MALTVVFEPTPDRTHKNCTRCGLLLTINKFWKNKSKADNRESSCIKCTKKERRRHEETHVS